MASNKDTAISSQHSAISRAKSNRKTNTRKSSKTRRRARRNDDSDRVTTFPEVRGKVVREVRFTHDDPENILAIAFKDRTVLVFEVDPKPLVLPVDIRAHYIGESRNATRTWEELAGKTNSS